MKGLMGDQSSNAQAFHALRYNGGGTFIRRATDLPNPRLKYIEIPPRILPPGTVRNKRPIGGCQFHGALRNCGEASFCPHVHGGMTPTDTSNSHQLAYGSSVRLWVLTTVYQRESLCVTPPDKRVDHASISCGLIDNELPLSSDILESISVLVQAIREAMVETLFVQVHPVASYTAVNLWRIAPTRGAERFTA